MCGRGHSLASLGLLGLGLLVAGCGPQGVQYPQTGATLEGTVTYGKEKVGAALVIAQNDSGSATAFVGDDGRFKLENVPLGEVNLAVNTDAGKGQATGKLMAGAKLKLIDVPKNFADPTRSGIKTTIDKGPNTYNIVIPQ